MHRPAAGRPPRPPRLAIVLRPRILRPLPRLLARRALRARHVVAVLARLLGDHVVGILAPVRTLGRGLEHHLTQTADGHQLSFGLRARGTGADFTGGASAGSLAFGSGAAAVGALRPSRS